MEGFDPHHHQHQHLHQQQHQQQQLQQHQQQQIPLNAPNIDVAGDRFPQWTIQETRDFLVIRAELDQAFMETKRNKSLWELIASQMREKGYTRSTEQCKCKWKNLVTRYKGCETMELESMRQQFPFYTELQTIFAARMQRMLHMETEGGSASGSKRKGIQSVSSDEDEYNDPDSDADKKVASKKKRKATPKGGTSSSNAASTLKEVLDEFMQRQMEMEMEWMKAYEAREEARKQREIEWRKTMEALERERAEAEKMWREREEQRRAREEARAEKRDALVTTLLNKLRREDR